jgi:acyl-CoA thioester hydrolase
MDVEILPPAEAFEMAIAVAPEDIDVMGHVNNVVYVRWVQDVAVAHWRAGATREQQNAIAWVVVRHEIDYKRPAMPGDTVVARTWVGTATAQTFERHTEILRNGKVLVRARTLWCPVDIGSGRPLRVPQQVRDQFSVPEADAQSKEQ